MPPWAPLNIGIQYNLAPLVENAGGSRTLNLWLIKRVLNHYANDNCRCLQLQSRSLENIALSECITSPQGCRGLHQSSLKSE